MWSICMLFSKVKKAPENSLSHRSELTHGCSMLIIVSPGPLGEVLLQESVVVVATADGKHLF